MTYLIVAALAVIGALTGIVAATLYAWRKDVRELRACERMAHEAQSTAKTLEFDNRELRAYLEQTKEVLRNEVARTILREERIAREGTPEEVVAAFRGRLTEPMVFETRTPPAGTPLPPIPEPPFVPRDPDIVDTLRLRLREPLDAGGSETPTAGVHAGPVTKASSDKPDS